jgi:hypothetical protein
LEWDLPPLLVDDEPPLPPLALLEEAVVDTSAEDSSEPLKKPD